MDAVDGAEVVHLVDVTGDAERTHDLARGVADELPPASRNTGPSASSVSDCMKAGFSLPFAAPGARTG